MIALGSKSKSTKRFIARSGLDVVVGATFWITEEAPIDGTTLKVHDALGLIPGAVFLLGESDGVDNPTDQPIEIQSVTAGIVTLTAPLIFVIPADTLMTLETSTKALFIIPGRPASRDVSEMSRQVRLASDVIVAHGSVLTFHASRYFVTGYQEGDSSLTLGLKLINEIIDWYSLDPSVKETVLGWGSTSVIEEADRDWPTEPGLVLIQAGIPTYQEQLSASSNLEEPGYIPRLNRLYMIQNWIQIKVGDFIKSSSNVMRVTNIDPTRVRNMKAVYVDDAKGVELNG